MEFKTKRITPIFVWHTNDWRCKCSKPTVSDESVISLLDLARVDWVVTQISILFVYLMMSLIQCLYQQWTYIVFEKTSYTSLRIDLRPVMIFTIGLAAPVPRISIMFVYLTMTLIDCYQCLYQQWIYILEKNFLQLAENWSQTSNDFYHWTSSICCTELSAF